MAVLDGLALFQGKDRPANRRQLIERLEGWMQAEAAAACGLSEIDGPKFESRHQNSKTVP
jgi:hypothetical protein